MAIRIAKQGINDKHIPKMVFYSEFIYWKIKALDNFVNIFNRCRICFVASCIMMGNLTEL